MPRDDEPHLGDGGLHSCGTIWEMPPEEDFALLHGWRGGDRAAGNELTRRYYPSVLGFFKLRAPGSADDLAQRTFLACTEAKDRIEQSTFRGYLFGVARRLLARHFEELRKSAALEGFEGAAPLSLLSPSVVVRARQEQWLLLRALESLDEDKQTATILYYVHGLRSREVGDAMGLSTSAVTTRLSRTRDELRARIRKLHAPPLVRSGLLDDLESWTRSLGQLEIRTEPQP